MTKKKIPFICLSGSIMFFLAYYFLDDFVGVSFTHYVHHYRFSLKNVFLLVPALFLLSLYLSSSIFIEPCKKVYIVLMKYSAGVLLIVMSFSFIIAAAAVSLIVLEGIPHVQDSIVQYFQAKIFAAGKLTVPSPEFPEFFDMQFVIDHGGERFGKYLWGQSVFPLVGVLLGIPWLINPIFGGVSLVLIYFLANELFNNKCARLTILLLLTSPFYFFMHSSFLSHPPSLFFTTLCVLCVVRTCRSDIWFYPIFGAAAFGMAFNIKPFSALLITVPFLLYGLFNIAGNRYFWKKIALFLIPSLLLISCFFFYNNAVFGDFFTTGYELYDPDSGLGFGPEKGEDTLSPDGSTPPGHTQLKGLKAIAKMGIALSEDLFGWPDLSLVFVVLVFVLFRVNRWELLLAGSVLFVTAGYFFYWGTTYSICFGPRYYFACIPMLVILTARGIEKTADGLQSWSIRKSWACTCNPAGAVGLFVFLLCCLNFTNHVPRCIELYGSSYWNVNTDIVEQVKSRGIENALVFVESEYYRGPHTAPDYYNAAFIHNDVLLRGDVLYARDLGQEENRKLMEVYPERDFYLFKQTSLEERTLIKL